MYPTQHHTRNCDVAAALLTFAEACCKEYRLPDKVKADVMRTVTLPGSNYMSMRTYACMQAMRLEANHTQVDDFLKSNTFKETIKRRLQGGLLDPKIPYYVYGCTARFIRHMRENPAVYEIPQVVREGLLSTRRFSSAVGEILSGFRGELRRKIFGSIEDKTDIASTSEKLATQGYLLSEDHLKQFALLRRLSEDYIEDEATAQAKKAVENAVQAKNRGRGKRWRAAKSASVLDVHRFPNESKEVSRSHRPGSLVSPANQLVVTAWQADASFAVQVMAGYTLTAAQERQEAPLMSLGATDEDEDVANQQGPPEDEEDSSTGRDENGSVQQHGPDGHAESQDDPSIQSNNPTNSSWNQHTKREYTPDSVESAPTRYQAASLGNVDNSLSNNGAPGNYTPQRLVRRPPPDSVGPVRGTPGPPGGRVTTLAQTSRGSPFPSSSRASTPQAPRGLYLGAQNTGGGGPVTQGQAVAAVNATAPRRPAVEPYDPVASETGAAYEYNLIVDTYTENQPTPNLGFSLGPTRLRIPLAFLSYRYQATYRLRIRKNRLNFVDEMNRVRANSTGWVLVP
ncbi:hypothetical protein B0J17DRAFT_634437 [Rhizoctonia solani]|nr:hypothetical protein B0J17DRAFT_634437 [Rhizoctonia solani]